MTLLTDLQSATEGSRELSDRMLLACGEYTLDADGCYRDYQGYARAMVGRPNPTQNLQDAVSLVPEGTWYWHIRKHSSSGRRHDAIVTLRKPGETADRCQFQARHRTPAIALCIAIIKAMEAKAEATP